MNEKNARIQLRIAVIIAFLGFLDALYLVYSEFSGNFFCPLEGGMFQCREVSTHPLAKLFGIVHISILGAIFYFVVIIMLFLAIFNKSDYWLSFFLPIAGIWGVIFSIYLTILEAFVIKFFCEFCILSAIFTVILMALILFSKKNMFGSLLAKLDFWKMFNKNNDESTNNLKT